MGSYEPQKTELDKAREATDLNIVWLSSRPVYGAKSEDVKRVQERLNVFGHPTTVDGSFGPKTRQSILAFQTANDLVPSGTLSDATLNKLIIQVMASEQTPVDPIIPKLSWESKNPSNRVWTVFVVNLIGELLGKLELATDKHRLYPNYAILNRNERIHVWAEFICQMAYYESSWEPTRRFHEDTMGIDPITKKPVYSEGLLQLSYQDVIWAKFAQFSWEADKDLPVNDPRKTILDPIKNLDAGIRILARQIESRKLIFLSSGAYWAVIKEGGRFQKINEILRKVHAIKFMSIVQPTQDPPHLRAALADAASREWSEIRGPAHNPKIIKAIQLAGLTGDLVKDETAWCGCYVNLKLIEAGVSTSKLPKGPAWAANWRIAKYRLPGFKRGAIACVPSKEASSGWHVTFAESQVDNKTNCVGGNQANTVNITAYPTSGIEFYWIE